MEQYRQICQKTDDSSAKLCRKCKKLLTGSKKFGILILEPWRARHPSAVESAIACSEAAFPTAESGDGGEGNAGAGGVRVPVRKRASRDHGDARRNARRWRPPHHLR